MYAIGVIKFLINNKPYQDYFMMEEDRQTAVASMKKMKCLDKFKISVIVKGGGRNAQAEAVQQEAPDALGDLDIEEDLENLGHQRFQA